METEVHLGDPVKSGEPSGKANQPKGRFKSSERIAHSTKSKVVIQFLPILEILFFIVLIFTGLVNSWGAWEYSFNKIFFTFSIIGVISLELVIVTIYKNWKDGHLLGKMLMVGKLAVIVATVLLVSGTLLNNESTNELLVFYHRWVLPVSVPIMFFFTFWLQSVDPILTAERDTLAYKKLVNFEEELEGLDKKTLEITHQRDRRRLRYHVLGQKIRALLSASKSRETQKKLKEAATSEVSKLALSHLIKEILSELKKESLNEGQEKTDRASENPSQKLLETSVEAVMAEMTPEQYYSYLSTAYISDSKEKMLEVSTLISEVQTKATSIIKTYQELRAKGLK